MPNQPPVCLSILLCDSVAVDRSTGKATILGLFDDIKSTAYPARHPELTLFAELTDGRGQTTVSLKVCQTNTESIDGTELYRSSMDVVFPDPRFIQRLLLTIAPFDIPSAGEYRFVLETEGAFIAERRLIARQVS